MPCQAANLTIDCIKQDLVTHRMMLRCVQGVPARAQSAQAQQQPYHFQAKLLVQIGSVCATTVAAAVTCPIGCPVVCPVVCPVLLLQFKWTLSRHAYHM